MPFSSFLHLSTLSHSSNLTQIPSSNYLKLQQIFLKNSYMQETKVIKKTIYRTHIIIALISISLIVLSVYLINKFSQPIYSITQFDQASVLTKTLSQPFDKVFQYLKLIQSILTMETISLQLIPNPTRPTYNWMNEQILQLYKINGGFRCATVNCSIQSISIFGNLLWQFKIFPQYLPLQNLYLGSKTYNNTWNLIQVPNNDTLLNININNIKLSQDWQFIKYNSELLFGKLITFSKENLNFIILAHFSKDSFYQNVESIAKKVIKANYIEIEDNFGWYSYHFVKTQELRNQSFAKEIRINTSFSNPLIFKMNLYQYEQNNQEKQLIGVELLSYIHLYFFLLLIIIYLDERNIDVWIDFNFRQILKVNLLFQYNINEMFSSRKPKNTLIYQHEPLRQFYFKLSQIPNPNFAPIVSKAVPQDKSQAFKFQRILKKIFNHLKQQLSPILQQNTRQILNHKFSIHFSINSLYQAQALRLKQNFLQVKETYPRHFFKLAYSAFLQETKTFLSTNWFVESFPEKIIVDFIQINQMLKGQTIWKTFNINPNITEITYSQLRLRIQGNLFVKFLLILKGLDIKNAYVKQLGFQKQLRNKCEEIQNFRYLFGKYNKNKLNQDLNQ